MKRAKKPTMSQKLNDLESRLAVAETERDRYKELREAAMTLLDNALTSHQFPLRDTHSLQIHGVPKDLTMGDVERVTMFLLSLVKPTAKAPAPPDLGAPAEGEGGATS